MVGDHPGSYRSSKRNIRSKGENQIQETKVWSSTKGSSKRVTPGKENKRKEAGGKGRKEGEEEERKGRRKGKERKIDNKREVTRQERRKGKRERREV